MLTPHIEWREEFGVKSEGLLQIKFKPESDEGKFLLKDSLDQKVLVIFGTFTKSMGIWRFTPDQKMNRILGGMRPKKRTKHEMNAGFD